MKENLTERQANQYSPLSLAFLGDSVYEQLVREKILLTANMPASKLHTLKISRVCAEYQSKAVDIIMPVLSEKEEAVFKRGRNATGNTVPKHAGAVDYRRATGLECLFGYLHLIGEQERLEELFGLVWNMEDFIIE
ncbi:MAG: ribonuclease III [Oscillospiraceae bacterium]|nr:ribonuclease III [Oscillospiraceae bacterium]